MVYPNTAKWGQTNADLLQLAMELKHQRTRERWLALYMIASRQTNATQWAKELGRTDDTVLSWVHRYNRQRSCGARLSSKRRSHPPFSREQVAQIVQTVEKSTPVEHNLPAFGCTVKKVKRWVEARFQLRVSRSLLWRILRRGRLSWKKCRKVLKKADPEKRRAYIEVFAALYEQMCSGKLRLVYVDEAHFHRDLDAGYTWSLRNEPAYRLSDCAPLSDRINWYGAYDFSQRPVFHLERRRLQRRAYGAVPEKLAAWLGYKDVPTIIIWDGAPWHRNKTVQQKATELKLTLQRLPGYSPDLNPIEGLWKWMRVDVTQQFCYPTMRELFDACKAFIDRINQDADAVVKRLWSKFELDPEYEKLLIS